MTIKAVLFDLGNTLLYFDGEWPAVIAEAHAALQHSLERAGLRLDWPAFLQEFSRRVEAYYAERNTEFVEYTTQYVLQAALTEFGFPDQPKNVLAPAISALYSVSQEHWIPESDALPMLDELRRHGYRMGIISNAADDADVQKLVDKGSFRPYMDFVITSAAKGIRKPNPRIFMDALAHWGVQPSEAVMIGDTLGADILGAQMSGIHDIWISRRAEVAANRAHLDTIHPQHTITTLSELPGQIEHISACANVN